MGFADFRAVALPDADTPELLDGARGGFRHAWKFLGLCRVFLSGAYARPSSNLNTLNANQSALECTKGYKKL